MCMKNENQLPLFFTCAKKTTKSNQRRIRSEKITTRNEINQNCVAPSWESVGKKAPSSTRSSVKTYLYPSSEFEIYSGECIVRLLKMAACKQYTLPLQHTKYIYIMYSIYARTIHRHLRTLALTHSLTLDEVEKNISKSNITLRVDVMWWEEEKSKERNYFQNINL